MTPGHVAYSIAVQEEPDGKVALAKQFGKPTPNLADLFHHVPMDGGHVLHRYSILRHRRDEVVGLVSETLFRWNPTTRVWTAVPGASVVERLDMHPAAVKDRLYRCGLIPKETQ